MNKWRRAILSITLVTFLAGCSGYKTAVIPGTGDPSQPLDSDAPALAEGMFAKVFLLSGETLKGEVVRFDSEILTIGRVGNFGFEKTDVLFSDIDKVEVEAMSQATSVVGFLGGTVFFVFAGILVLLIIGCAVGDCDYVGS